MKRVLMAFALISAPAVALAQSTPTPAPAPTPAPSDMGRWDEYRERQEEMRRIDDARASGESDRRRRGIPVRGSDDARLVVDTWGQCVVTNLPEWAITFVADMGQSEQPSTLRGRFSGCVADRISVMTFPYPSMHALIADNLIRQSPEQFAATDFTGVGLPLRLFFREREADDIADMSARERREYEEDRARRGTWLAMWQLGECISRRAPTETRAMLLTPVASEAEAQAISSLHSPIAACIEPGSTVRLRAETLRQALALTFYHLNLARRTAATEAGDA